ncbi:fibronectin type III domain-containing protein [Hanamia caeni]|nr:fibronectin type III domain-containing protein [Hanamia caeni]
MITASDLFDGVVIRPYRSWSDITLSTETTRIQLSMTDNASFPSPSPTMEVFSAAVGAYVTQLAKAATRDANAIAAKNARRAELIALCEQLGNSVTNTAYGNVEMLVSTGLPLRKKRQSVVLSAPSNLGITNGVNSGELDVRVDRQKGATGYSFDYTEDPLKEDSLWVQTLCSTSRCTIKGLTPGKRYWIRPVVIGPKGQKVVGDMMLSPFVQ